MQAVRSVFETFGEVHWMQFDAVTGGCVEKYPLGQEHPPLAFSSRPGGQTQAVRLSFEIFGEVHLVQSAADDGDTAEANPL